MGRLDLFLAIFFGIASLASLGAAIWCLRQSFRASGQRDGDIKMFVWAMGAIFGLIVSAMCAAYILLPIFLHY
jgi:hypothetical protein